jgi:hypothetical protein
MSETEKLADRIRQTLPTAKSGTLATLGRIGKQYDNWHQIVRCEAEPLHRDILGERFLYLGANRFKNVPYLFNSPL